MEVTKTTQMSKTIEVSKPRKPSHKKNVIEKDERLNKSIQEIGSSPKDTK